MAYSVFFDASDYELLKIVNDVLERFAKPNTLQTLISGDMHPNGIKELAASKGLRIAYASACLLGSLEAGKASDRIQALRSLRDEVLLSSTSYFQKNTARVLLQIMKELLRNRNMEEKQLQLAHDFHRASSGRPKVIRAELAKYFLLEMPEAWNQVSFDDRVHDANTKGRKSPTHLVMDAWIKGIRKLTVVYYNYVDPAVVEELLEASEILDVHVQVGIELSANFRNRYIRFTWEPCGFSNNQAILRFFHKEEIKGIIEEGRQVSQYQQTYVFSVIEAYNHRHRLVLERELELDLPSVDTGNFLGFVGTGQPSILHLAKYIHQSIEKVIEEQGAQTHPGKADEQLMQLLNQQFASLDIERLIDRFLKPQRNPELQDVSVPQFDERVPGLLRLSPPQLLKKLSALHNNSFFTLNLSNVSVQDTLELLYICEGNITHLESYNLKTANHGLTGLISSSSSQFVGEAVDLVHPDRNYSLIGQLQKGLNENNIILLKKAIHAVLDDFDSQQRSFQASEYQGQEWKDTWAVEAEKAAMEERREVLMNILVNMTRLHGYYLKRTLGSRIGSGSTGQAEHQYGMGLVVLETLPIHVQRKMLKEFEANQRTCLPITASLIHHQRQRLTGMRDMGKPGRMFFFLPLLNRFQSPAWNDWSIEKITTHPGVPGNVLTLGGLRARKEENEHSTPLAEKQQSSKSLRYLNTNLKNILKVLIGFIPAFLTFSLTKDWWVLAYLGAFIWFGITGIRNVIQSVLGGGGLRRSPLLPWTYLVDWGRISDSLLYTGFSVPLLDFLVKSLLLDQTFGITTANNPLALYAVMGFANGCYISGHNLFRGLPKNAAIGNFFRSILSIPLAVLLNSCVGSILVAASVPLVDQVLQKWAAIISKLASDTVAAIIEGLTDRQVNIRMRIQDYTLKVQQIFSVFAQLDVLMPKENVLELLRTPRLLKNTSSPEASNLQRALIINALDLMYFWYFKPRSRRAFRKIQDTMSREEQLIVYRSQPILLRFRTISRLFVDGLVGRDFARALAFYLDNWQSYLKEMEKLETRLFPVEKKSTQQNQAEEENEPGSDSGQSRL